MTPTHLILLSEPELAADAEWWALYEAAFPPDTREPAAVILESLRRGVGLALAARQEGRTMGIATAHLLRHPPAVFLVYLAVDPTVQGQGMGRALLEEVWTTGRSHLAAEGRARSGMIWEVGASSSTPGAAPPDTDSAPPASSPVGFYRKCGATTLPGPYFQPALTAGLPPVPMQLMYRPAPGSAVPEGDGVRELIRAMYEEKYRALNGLSIGSIHIDKQDEKDTDLPYE